MSKASDRQDRLNRHYRTLEALAKQCGVTQPDGKKLSLALLKLERQAHKLAEDECNGDCKLSDEQVQARHAFIAHEVTKLFNNKLEGFFINGDPRGYALKIKDDIIKTVYAYIGLHTDWGGYGILAPWENFE